ncbi:hypothetical protein TRIUR3_26778 [Triticum urartu]|uniref:Uncharacterized protein n=1 Tax=Triticum urartu TaxID=4572 RepID=M7Z880_TRIUA|nr:hypothetical protein TRIUR3_26778 [Triticum urartu]
MGLLHAPGSRRHSTHLARSGRRRARPCWIWPSQSKLGGGAWGGGLVVEVGKRARGGGLVVEEVKRTRVVLARRNPFEYSWKRNENFEKVDEPVILFLGLDANVNLQPDVLDAPRIRKDIDVQLSVRKRMANRG